MATKWISPTWRMPTDTQSPAGSGNNQSKFDNYSLNFNNSVTNKINCGPANAYNVLTLSAWVKPNNPVSYAGIFGTRNGAAPINFPYQLTVDNTKRFRFLFSGTTQIISDNQFVDGIWYHVVGIFDGTTLKMYVNGELQGDTATSSSVPTPTNDLMIGAQWDTDAQYEWDGEISQCSLFDYALSETQIKYLYNNNDTVNPTVANPQNPMAIPGNSPIAYYDLGGSSTGDAAAASPNTLTVPNSSVPSATVFDFSGGTDNISVPQTSTLEPSNVTVSVWFKGGTQPSYTYLVSKLANSGSKGYALYTGASSDKLRFFIYNGSSWVLTPYAGVVMDNNWHHAAATFDGTNLKLYVDGSPYASNTSTSGITYDGGPLVIGAQKDNGTLDFDGELSNVQIWNTNLSSAQITTLYNNGKPYLGTQPQAANLKGWWRMNIDTSNWDGSNWTISDTNVNWKNSLNFNNDAIIRVTSTSTPNTPVFATGQSISCSLWIRPADLPSLSLTPRPVGLQGSVNFNDDMIRLRNLQSPDKVVLQSNSGPYGTTQLNDGTWHHIVFTYNFSTGATNYYIDGNSTPELTGSLTPVASLKFKLTIGANFSNTLVQRYKGQLSNLLIFENKVLTTSEISTLYNGGVPELTPSFSPTSWWKLDNTTTGIQDSIGSNDGTNDGAVASGIAVSQVNGTSSGMTTANLVNSDLERSIPYSSYSMEFDGFEDYIDLNNTSETTPASAYTISAWAMKTGAGTGSFPTIISSQKTAANQGGWTLAEYTSTNKWRAYIDTTGSGGWVYAESDATITSSQWYHLVAHWDGSTITLYVDGVAQTTTAAAATISYGTITQNATIGTYASNDFQGKISNCAIFSSALTQDQILTIYNGGVPNDISSLSPVGWWSLAGDSYYNGTNWICPDLGSGGNNGTSSGMGGSELVGNAPGGSANGTATNMDIPANLKGDAPNSSSNAFSVNMNFEDKTNDVPLTP